MTTTMKRAFGILVCLCVVLTLAAATRELKEGDQVRKDGVGIGIGVGGDTGGTSDCSAKGCTPIPGVQIPGIQIPQIPGIQIPQIPGIQIPGIQIPQIPGIQIPQIPGISIPGVQIPGITIPGGPQPGCEGPLQPQPQPQPQPIPQLPFPYPPACVPSPSGGCTTTPPCVPAPPCMSGHGRGQDQPEGVTDSVNEDAHNNNNNKLTHDVVDAHAEHDLKTTIPNSN